MNLSPKTTCLERPYFLWLLRWSFKTGDTIQCIIIIGDPVKNVWQLWLTLNVINLCNACEVGRYMCKNHKIVVLLREVFMLYFHKKIMPCFPRSNSHFYPLLNPLTVWWYVKFPFGNYSVFLMSCISVLQNWPQPVSRAAASLISWRRVVRTNPMTSELKTLTLPLVTSK